MKRKQSIQAVLLLSAAWLTTTLISCPSAAADRDHPDRHGFTFEVGMGVGLIEVAGLPTRNRTLVDWGLEPHSLSLGGFLTRRLALLYRFSSTYYSADTATGHGAQGALGTHGLQLQYWGTPNWFIAGGPALAYFGNFLNRDDGDPPIKFGPGFTFRTGYVFLRLGPAHNHSFSFAIKATSGFFDARVASGQTFNVEYQWF